MARPVAESTRNRILDAAEQCFICQGYAATSMREIATESATSNSLIVHHFSTKLGLWEAVKQRRMADFVVRQQSMLSLQELNLEQFLQAIRDYFELLRDDPALVQLLARAELEQDLGCSRFKQELVTAFVQRIAKGQALGIFRDSLNPAHVLALILCALTQWMEAKHMFTSWDEMQHEDDPDSGFVNTFIDILLHGVQGEKA